MWQILMTKHVPRAVLDKLAGMISCTFLDEETQKFQEYASINQNYWNQKMAAVERLPVCDDGQTNRWRMMDTTSHLTTAVLRRGVETSYNNYIYTDHRDL